MISTTAKSQSFIVGNKKHNAFLSLIKQFAYITILIALLGNPIGTFLVFPAYADVTLLLILFLAFLIALNKISGNSWTLPNINLLLPISLFLGFSAISIGYAPDKFFAIRAIGSMASKVMLFLFVIDLFDQTRDIQPILSIIAIIGTIVSLQGISLVIGVTFFNLEPMMKIDSINLFGNIDYNFNLYYYGILGFSNASYNIGNFEIPRAYSFFVEPSWFSIFLELSIFASLGLISYQKKQLKNRSVIIFLRRISGSITIHLMIWIQIIALFLSLSTGSFAAIGIGFITYTLIKKRNVLEFAKKAFSWLLVVLLITLITYWLYPQITKSLYETIWIDKFDALHGGTSSGEDRLYKATTAIELFSESPIWGWGTNQMRVVSNGQFALNAFLTVAVELGIIGLMLYTLVLITIIRTVFFNYQNVYRCKSPQLIQLTASLSGAVLSLTAHSMIVDLNWIFLYWISLALFYINNRLIRKVLLCNSQIVF